MRILTYVAFAASVVLPSSMIGQSLEARTRRRYALATVGAVVAVALMALAFVLWPLTARQSSVEVATTWGLPGVWQGDCQAPIRADNPRYNYSVEEGKLLLRRDFGGGITDASVISDVEITPTGEIHYVVHFVQLGDNRQGRLSRQNLLIRSADGRIRTFSNKPAGTGQPSVVGGIRADDLVPTPWLNRCRLG